MRGQARAGRPHRRQRGQPRSQALPVAVGRRDRHPAGPPGPAPAGRGRVAQGPGRRGQLRLGLVPQPGQPGPARPHRAGRRGVEGPVRPGPSPGPARARGPAPPGDHDGRRVHGGHARRVGAGPRERHARRAPRPVPGRAAPALRRALHLRGRRGTRPVHGLGVDRGRRGAHGPPLPRLRHRPRLRRGLPRPGGRRARAGAGPGRGVGSGRRQGGRPRPPSCSPRRASRSTRAPSARRAASTSPRSPPIRPGANGWSTSSAGSRSGVRASAAPTCSNARWGGRRGCPVWGRGVSSSSPPTFPASARPAGGRSPTPVAGCSSTSSLSTGPIRPAMRSSSGFGATRRHSSMPATTPCPHRSAR